MVILPPPPPVSSPRAAQRLGVLFDQVFMFLPDLWVWRSDKSLPGKHAVVLSVRQPERNGLALCLLRC